MSEWKEKKLGELGFTFTGLSGKTIKDFGSGKPYIPYLNIFNNPIIDVSILDYVVINSYEKQNKVKKGDLFFTTSSETFEEVGMTSVLLDELEECYLNSFCFGFRLHNFDELLPEFAPHLFRSESIRKIISDLGQGSTRYNLPKTELLNRLILKIPDLPTQRKIARILSTADAVIEKTQAAIAKYKAIKQGMLHDLFTHGIDPATNKLRPTYEDAPHLYKESKLGWIPKEWEVGSLGEVCSMKSGDGITSLRIRNLDDYPVYGGNGLRGFTNSFTHDGEYILIGRQGALCGNITRVSGKFYASEHAVVVTVEKDIDVDWLSQKLETMKLNQYSEASAQPGLSVNKVMKLLVVKTLFEEQEKISNRLISIDNKLQTEQTYLQKVQQIKAGLMADLLTGKKEVHIDEDPAN